MRRSLLTAPLLALALALGCPGSSPTDGGVGHDAGATDGGQADAGSGDGGAELDAGAADDAGTSDDDAGLPPGGDGGGDLADTAAVEACPAMSSWPSPDLPEAYQRLVFADEQRAVVVYRTYSGPGAGHTAAYEAGGFGLDLGTADGAACVTDAAALSYAWSHHNWNDDATAEIGDVTWKLGIQFQPEDDEVTGDWVWTYPLTAVDDDGEVLEGPYYLTLVSGTQ